MSTPGPPMTVFVTLTNVDAVLTPPGWAELHGKVAEMIDRAGGIFQGEWFCGPTALRQTACWCVDIQPGVANTLKGKLGAIGAGYGRGMVAWSEVSTAVYLG